jgi:dynein heavy chain
MPALNNAIKALDSLSKSDITEVKSFAKPPPAVQTVMEAVCILLGEKPDWDSAKKLLTNAGFMDSLKTYDKDNIPASYIKKIKKYTAMEEMAVDNVKKVSKAATSLCMWVHAMDVYSDVAKEVEPKKARLEEMNQMLASANATLKEKQDQLQGVLDKVAELKAQCDAAVAEKNRLQNEADLTKARLDRAGKLTTGLADEQVRWTESVGRFEQMIADLVGDVLISAACISYYGAFTGPYREQLVKRWHERTLEVGIPCSPTFSLLSTMGDPVQVREWQINGLPTDSVSTDNAILVTRGKRWPLMIDPQEQAKRWIKNTEAKSGLAVTRLTNPNMLRTLENCIRIGKPLLLEDIGETLDPALEPVLQRAVFKQSGRLLIRLGDSDVDYDPTFRLYMSTKLPNPHYLPEVCIKVTVINFTVTLSGLEDQLLGAVVRKERPDVEERKNRLVVSMAADKNQLQDLEDKILKLLSESEGNILDDEVLIETLGESKDLSKVINERLAESEKTNIEIDEMRQQYKPAATRGSIIYFVVADLARMDPMYQYSLAYFVRLFNVCIDESEKAEDIDTRLSNLMSYLTQFVYTNVCRGLFEEHKLIFSFLICVQIMRNAGEIEDMEWSLLLRGAGMVANEAPNPMPDLLSEPAWNLLAALEEGLPEQFTGLCEDVSSRLDDWRGWAESAEPHTAPLPSPWDANLNRLQTMLVLKAFREEKLLFSVKNFVLHNLGKPFVESPPTAMADVHADSDCSTPVVFILSVGADPTGMLFSFAKQRKYLDRLRIISLGQGQGPRAQQMIVDACKTGDWVLLQNCHLAKSWMPTLEKIVDTLGEVARGAGVEAGAEAAVPGLTSIHADFRLYLTSMPASYFPVPVLQNGVKLTNEPPRGIRANLTRSLAQIENWSPWEELEGEFADGSVKLGAWKKLAFGLCFFHAIIQERRKFGPLGWNIRYEFNDSDLETSVQVLKMFLDEQPEIPWDALRYVTGQINYGGRVTDDWDRRCLMSILGKFYTTASLSPDYKFSESGTYFSPAPAPLQSFVEYVDQLPLDDDPEIFGMHENANITFQSQETDNIIKTALSIQPRSGGAGAGRSPDEIAGDLAATIEAELPAVLDHEEAGSTTFVYKGEHMDSLATVLMQEMARFNKLLVVMAGSLADLQRAIRGEVLMSDELDKMFTALINNQVPELWETAAYPSLKPLASWVKDLHARITFMRDWLRNGQPGVFWLSGFFFPQGFMTGALQNHARKYAIPIDTLAFSFKMLTVDAPEEVRKADVPEDGVLINGLFMDGARWDKEARTVSDPRPGEMYSPVPIIHFVPTPNYEPAADEYSAPIYKTSVRAGTLSTTGMSTNFIVAVEMPTVVDPSYWVLKGAALLCQLND